MLSPLSRFRWRLMAIFLFVGYLQGSLLHKSSTNHLRSLKEIHDPDNENPLGHNIPAEEETHKSFSLLLLVTLEMSAFLTAYFIKMFHIKYLQEAGVTMLFGTLVGLFTHFTGTKTSLRLEEALTFDPTIFFLFLLPPIIYE